MANNEYECKISLVREWIIAIKSLMNEYFHGCSHLGGIMSLDSSILFILGLFNVHSFLKIVSRSSEFLASNELNSAVFKKINCFGNF